MIEVYVYIKLMIVGLYYFIRDLAVNRYSSLAMEGIQLLDSESVKKPAL